jgi:hypothetical protein
LFVLFIGGQTLARYLYYGDVLPNTYYLKRKAGPSPAADARDVCIHLVQLLQQLGFHVAAVHAPAMFAATGKWSCSLWSGLDRSHTAFM